MSAPLARYRHKIVEFAHDLTPLKLNEKEQRVFREFECGARSGLGFHAWGADGLCRALYLSYLIVAWRTLCFEFQLTGIYGKNQRRALPWINGFSIFVNQCDTLISRQLMFDLTAPRVTLNRDEFWRVLVFNPNESELEAAKSYLTNVIYYDFDKVPEWLVHATQESLRRDDAGQTITLAILTNKPKNLPVTPPTEPQPYVDGPSDSDD